jgi:hypothetical protein
LNTTIKQLQKKKTQREKKTGGKRNKAEELVSKTEATTLLIKREEPFSVELLASSFFLFF